MENIKEILDDIFNDLSKSAKREIKILYNCKTFGFTDFKRICGDKDCITCRSFEKALREEMGGN